MSLPSDVQASTLTAHLKAPTWWPKKEGTRADSCPIPASIPRDGCGSWLQAAASGYARAADASPTLVLSAPVLR
jgi:hypothetical protein